MADMPQSVTIPLAWIGVEDVPVVHVNQMVLQMDPTGEVFYLVLGQSTPPFIFGTPEEQMEGMSHVPFVQVRPIARVSVTPTVLRDWVNVLEETLRNLESMKRAREEVQ